MIGFDRYDELVGHIYDGATDASRWPGILERLALAMGASRAVLYTYLHGPDDGGFCVTYRLPQQQLAVWAARTRTDDPFVQAGLAGGVLVDGAVWEGCELVPRPQLVESRLYRDIWVPWDIEHICIAIVFDGRDAKKLPTSLSLFRTPRDEAFSAAEVALMRRLVVHLSRALGVMFHLRDAGHALAATRAALDRLSGAVLLLGADKQVIYRNTRAAALLERADLLRLAPAGGRGPACELACAAASTGAAAALRRTLDGAVADPARDEGRHFSQAVVLPDAAGRPRAVVHAAALGANGYEGEDGRAARAVVFVYPLDRAAAVAPETLRQLFGLTPAEAAAALALPAGGSLAAIAGRLGISVNTLKSQLKAVYAKTQTQRQVDLLKLLASLGPP